MFYRVAVEYRLPRFFSGVQYTQLRSAGFFCGRPCDVELVTRQYGRPGHQQRLLQTFAEDVFIFSLLVYIAH